MGVLRCKDGVEFKIIAPGGFEILAALVTTAVSLDCDLTITSGTDGFHSGENDPHHRGEAYDIRTHDLADPSMALQELQSNLDLTHFYAFLEAAGTENEHIHVQVKKGTTYP